MRWLSLSSTKLSFEIKMMHRFLNTLILDLKVAFVAWKSIEIFLSFRLAPYFSFASAAEAFTRGTHQAQKKARFVLSLKRTVLNSLWNRQL